MAKEPPVKCPGWYEEEPKKPAARPKQPAQLQKPAGSQARCDMTGRIPQKRQRLEPIPSTHCATAHTPVSQAARPASAQPAAAKAKGKEGAGPSAVAQATPPGLQAPHQDESACAPNLTSLSYRDFESVPFAMFSV